MVILRCIKEATNSICRIFFPLKVPDEISFSVESFKNVKEKRKGSSFKEFPSMQILLCLDLFTIRFVKLRITLKL